MSLFSNLFGSLGQPGSYYDQYWSQLQAAQQQQSPLPSLGLSPDYHYLSDGEWKLIQRYREKKQKQEEYKWSLIMAL